MRRDEHTSCTDPTLARAMAICRAHGYEPRLARELAAQDEELQRLRAAREQLALPLSAETPAPTGERAEGLELSDALAKLERLRELRREDARIVRAAMRLTRAEALAARTSTVGPAVIVHEREAMAAARELRDACADVALRRIARALRESDDAPADTPAAVDAIAYELRAAAGGQPT